ncbi:MAG: hypothetical protein QG628_284 [Patescibacteria group bacterium]|jgi:hypothetical protein|nr:hypothetical protein [Patescibacteria group bacterium]
MYFMTEYFPPAELMPDLEFEEQLDRAFSHPRIMDLKGNPTTSQEDLDARATYFAQQRQAPEMVKIRSFESPIFDYDVITADPSMYELLLMQAFRRLEMAKGIEDPGLVESDRIKKVVKHELEHGSMTAQFEHGSRYGFAVLHDSDENSWALSPFHKIIGNRIGEIFLTRLEDAAISVAPDEPSPADLHAAYIAGYSSREEVHSRLNEIHPLFMASQQEQ